MTGSGGVKTGLTTVVTVSVLQLGCEHGAANVSKTLATVPNLLRSLILKEFLALVLSQKLLFVTLNKLQHGGVFCCEGPGHDFRLDRAWLVACLIICFLVTSKKYYL